MYTSSICELFMSEARKRFFKKEIQMRSIVLESKEKYH